jgi:hypothetical protein
MPWPIFFKTIGIIYGLYYTLLIGYESICYYTKKSKQTNTGFQELDTSHLNIRPRQDFTPKLVDNIIPYDVVVEEETIQPQLVEYDEQQSFKKMGNDIEDIDNSLNFENRGENIEVLIERGRSKFSGFAKDIFIMEKNNITE